MSRLTLGAAALLLAVGGLLLARAVTAPAPSPAAAAAALAAELRCPDCQALSVAESRTAAADAIRREIGEHLAAGRSPDEIRGRFVARYGEWILLAPRDPLAWLAPAMVLLAGLGVLGWWLRARWRRPAPPAMQSSTDRAAGADEGTRLRDELEALDA
jgi:cytochrome c-type biogenesis protein CcmH